MNNTIFVVTPEYRRQRLVSRSVAFITMLFALSALVVLVWIIGYILIRGLSSLNVEFFTHEPKPFGEEGGGIVHAIVGTMVMVLAATILSAPFGIGIASFLSTSRKSLFVRLIRMVLDVLVGLPSILVGVAVWRLLVIPMHGFSGFAGSIALMVIMVPIIARSVEDVFNLVPKELKRTGKLLGMRDWQVLLKITLPYSIKSLGGCVVLAMVRAAGETAPLLLTTSGSNFFNLSLGKPMAALPLQIYQYATSPYPLEQNQAFATAIIVIGLSVVVKVLIGRYTRRAKHES
jgi:phosphate transport system permease protein